MKYNILLTHTKSVFFLGAFISILCLLPACTWFSNDSNKQEAKELLTSDNKLIIIDVNDKELYEKAHIKNAINIAYFDIMTNAEKTTDGWDKLTSYVVYCSNFDCTASKDVVGKLRELGFNAVAYEGGIAEWLQKGYAIEGAAPKSVVIPLGSPKDEQSKDLVIGVEELKNKLEKLI